MKRSIATATTRKESEYDLSSPIGSFIAMTKHVARAPSQFFAGINPHADYGPPLAFATICWLLTLILKGLLLLATGQQSVGRVFASIVLGALFAVIAPFVEATLLHPFVLLLARP